MSLKPVRDALMNRLAKARGTSNPLTPSKFSRKTLRKRTKGAMRSIVRSHIKRGGKTAKMETPLERMGYRLRAFN